MLNIMSCLQWVMQLVTGASQEGLGEMAAQAEQDVDSLIAMYAQALSFPFYQHQVNSSAARSWGLYCVTVIVACNAIWCSHAMAPRCDGNQGMLLQLSLHFHRGYNVTAQYRALFNCFDNCTGS